MNMRRLITLFLLVVACASAKAQDNGDIDRYVQWTDISGLAPGCRVCYIYESEKYLSFFVRGETYDYRFYISTPQKEMVHNIIYSNNGIGLKQQQVMAIVRFAISKLQDDTTVDRSGADGPAEGQSINDYIRKEYHSGRYVSVQELFVRQEDTRAETQAYTQGSADNGYDDTGDLLDNLTVTPQLQEDYIQEHPESDVAQYMASGGIQDSPAGYPEPGSDGYDSNGIQGTTDSQAADSLSGGASSLLKSLEGYGETIITLLFAFIMLKVVLKAFFSGDKKSDSDKNYKDMSWFNDNHKEM